MSVSQITVEDLCDILEAAAYALREHHGPYLVTRGEHPSFGRFIVTDTGLAPPLLIRLD